MKNFEGIYNETLESYTKAAEWLSKNNNIIDACDCSHQTARMLIDVDKGLYWTKFMWCLRNKETLELFTKSKATDIYNSQKSNS